MSPQFISSPTQCPSIAPGPRDFTRVAGLVVSAGTIACPLYRIFTGEAYVAMALLALLGAGGAFLLMRRWHGGLVAGHHPHS